MTEPMKQAELLREIGVLIEVKMNNGHAVPASWLTQEVVSHHPLIDGEDSDFYLLCAYEHVRYTVRDYLRKIKSEEDSAESAQQRLPGFEKLQKRYVVTENGEQVAMPIERMAKRHFLQKIEEKEAMAAGCLTHANELRRYMDDKFGVAEA